MATRVKWDRREFTRFVGSQPFVDDVQERGRRILEQAEGSGVDARWFWSDEGLTRRGKVPRFAILATGIAAARDFDSAEAALLAALDAGR